MFGGSKVSMGATFDPETYAKAKPLFEKAAGKFSSFGHDIAELLRRMVGEMQRIYGLTRDALENMRPYLKRFMQEVQQGIIQLAKAAKPEKPIQPRKADAKAGIETENQVTYTPKSDTPGLGTLVPVNMRRSIADSLDSLSKKVGDIDDYVANELGYKKHELQDYFGAEQVDALALAIDNIKRGKGFIIGDQTGIGKGRVNAAIIRWAIRNDRVPIFVTEKPNLYADMYCDLDDVGISDFLDRAPRILATNTGLKLPLNDEGSAKISNGDAKAHNDVLAKNSDPAEFAKNYDMVFTNYSQMQTVKEADTQRRQFLKSLVPNGVVIFDESHNAGGQKAARQSDNAPANRSGFARDLVRSANGVFYSSGTYAKRPDVMDLYAATDMAMAVEKIDDLAEAIARGGVPMQQVVASMLAQAGQYIRRERSFAGVSYDTPLVGVSRDKYDGISSALNLINELSGHVKDAASNLSEQLKAEAAGLVADNATGDAGASSTNFTAIMHNVINQMLLAMKVDPAAKMAIEALKRGEKPVLTVANTMESFLSDYAESMGIGPGGEMPADFADVLQKYLDRTRTVTIRKPHAKKGDVERKYLSDEELGHMGVNAYRAAKDVISRLDLSDLPMSPIDHLKDQLQKAGYKVGEITGRGTVIDYSGDQPVMQARPGKELSVRGRRETNSKFNNGQLDAIVLNQAGSTGISLHASEKFKDQRQRHMMIVQPEGNIDTHMQMLGRVHRTGQIVVPKYSQLVADIPAEKRPAAVLAKKMASLNANTTASRSGALTARDVPDFINDYGDAVAVGYIHDNPEMNAKLAFPIKTAESGALERVDAMRRLTGRIPLLPLTQQEEVYSHLESEYDALLKQMEAAGENSLEAKTLDLKAKTLETSEVVGAKSAAQSPFAAPVNVEKVSVARLGKPFSPAEVMQKLADQFRAEAPDDDQTLADTVKKDPSGDELGTYANMLGMFNNEPYNDFWGLQTREKETSERKEALDKFDSYMRGIVDDIEDPARADKERTKLNAVKDRWSAIHSTLHVGKRLVLKTSNGNLTAIVLNTEQKGEPKNPLALGTWKTTFAIADATRQITLPFSRLWMPGKSDSNDMLGVELGDIPQWVENARQTLERFAFGQNEAREDRYIATGNLLAAYDWLSHKGRIINYTDDAGAIRQGILTARDFDLSKQAAAKGKALRDPVEVKAWLDANIEKPIWAKDNAVRITKTYNGYAIATDKAKKTGGVFYLDRSLTGYTGDFYSRGGVMQTEVTESRILPAIKRLQELGAVFTAAAGAPRTTKVNPGPEMAAEMAAQPSRGLSDEAEARRLAQAAERRSVLTPRGADIQTTLEIANGVRDIVRRVAGPNISLGFTDKMVSQGAGWGGQGASTAGGKYLPFEDAIRIALNDPHYNDPDTVAYHEAWHAIEDHFLSDQEMELLKREEPRLRAIAGRHYGYTPEEAAGLADFEVRAIAFQAYAHDRANGGNGAGLHIGVRGIFDRLLRLFKAIANYLRGKGYQTYQDIFGHAFEGDMAERPSRKTDEGLPSRIVESLLAEHAKAEHPLEAALARPEPFETEHPGLSTEMAAAPRPKAGANNPPRSLPTRIRDAIAKVFESRAANKFIEYAQDLSHPVKLLQNELEARRGLPFGDLGDFYTRKRLYPGRVGNESIQFNKTHLDPLVEYMKAHAISLEGAGDYVYARHVAERNARLGALYPADHQFNKAMHDPSLVGASGQSQNWADGVMREAARQGKTAQFEHVAAAIQGIRKYVLEKMLSGGLIDQRTADQWKNQYKNYVDLRGFEDAPEDAPSDYREPSRFNVRGREVKQAFGRRSKADNPIVNMLDQAYRAIDRAERNRYLHSVWNALGRMNAENPGSISDIVRMDSGKPKKVISAKTGLVKTIDDSSFAGSPNTVTTKINGQPHHMLFESRDLAEAVKRMGPDQLASVFRGILDFQNHIKALWTHYSPDFLFRHFLFRYPIEGALNSFEQKESGPHSVGEYIKNSFPFFGSASKAIFQSNKGQRASDPELKAMQDYWDEMRTAGGGMMFRNMRDMDMTREHLRTQLMALNGKPIASMRERWRRGIEAMDVVTNALDNSLRLSAYASARKQGKSPQQAALVAREATVDFQLKGKWSQAMGLIWPFANIAIQTGFRMTKAVTRSKIMRRVFGSTVLAGFLAAAFNYMIGGNDKDGVPFFEKIPEWDRRLNFILLNPFHRDDKGRPVPIHIPMPYNWAFPLTIGHAMGTMVFGKEGVRKALRMVTRSALEVLTPFGQEENLAAAVTPEVFRPIVHAYTNENYNGLPIHADPDYQKGPNSWSGKRDIGGRVRTGDGWKYIAEGINAATGGSRVKSGALDFYPEDLRAMLDYGPGTQMRLAENVQRTAENAITDKPVEWAHVPIARVVLGTDYDAADRSLLYQNLDKTKRPWLH